MNTFCQWSITVFSFRFSEKATGAVWCNGAILNTEVRFTNINVENEAKEASYFYTILRSTEEAVRGGHYGPGC